MEDKCPSFRKIILIAVIIGIISGCGAYIFFECLKGGTWFFMQDLLGFNLPDEGQSPLTIAGWAPPANIWLFLPIICFGALLSGLIVYTFAPEAEGHGTDAAIKAFHSEGRVRWRVPLVKAATAVLTIASGGSAGREGPTAQISAGFGSIAADLLGLSPRERRIAIATGIGAGIGTIFKAPLGGAILGAEILYRRDFETEAIIPSFLASIIGYAIFGTLEGFDPIFITVEHDWTVMQLPLFLILGCLCAGFGLLYVKSFYGTTAAFRNFFERHHLPPHVKPLLGAFIIGCFVIALSLLSPEAEILALGSIGTGYGFLQLAMYNMLPLGVLILLPLTRIVTTSLTIGSGGSGGVFAPGLAIGGSLGGAFGMLCHMAAPTLVPINSVPAFVIVGMIALFGGIANAPIAVMMMVVEMTADFSLLVPAMGAVALSFVLTGDETIFRQQVETRAQSPAHRGEYRIEILQDITAGEVMMPAESLVSLNPEEECKKVLELIDDTGHTGFPVIADDHLVGIVTIGDLRPHKDGKQNGSGTVKGCMSTRLITLYPDDTLETALELMIAHNIHHIPVIAPERSDQIAGFVTSTDIMRAYSKRMSAGQQLTLKF